MKLTPEKKIAHGGHPVLRQMIANIYIRIDPARNIKADKEKSTKIIDGAAVSTVALDRAIRCGGDTSVSMYDKRGYSGYKSLQTNIDHVVCLCYTSITDYVVCNFNHEAIR